MMPPQHNPKARTLSQASKISDIKHFSFEESTRCNSEVLSIGAFSIKSPNDLESGIFSSELSGKDKKAEHLKEIKKKKAFWRRHDSLCCKTK